MSSLFSLDAWFETWCKELERDAQSTQSDWPPNTTRMVTEALSDAAPEQFLNPLVAQHLRRYGSRFAAEKNDNRVFWVRSEWEKVDLSYGLAIPFAPGPRAWNEAWSRGDTGDLGQIEVKAIYAHRSEGVMKTLAGQLEARRAKDVARRAPGAEQLRYHGLVWLFEHGDGGRLPSLVESVEAEANALKLQYVKHGTNVQCDLGRLWPSTGGTSYRCAFSIALFKL